MKAYHSCRTIYHRMQIDRIDDVWIGILRQILDNSVVESLLRARKDLHPAAFLSLNELDLLHRDEGLLGVEQMHVYL